MNKNIYDMLNDVKIDINNYDKEELNDIEKKRIKNNIKKSIKSKHTYKKAVSIAATAVISIGLLSTSFGSYAYAGINSFFYDIASVLGIEKNLDEYKTVVNQSITKNEITVQLNEVILDNDELIVSATSTFNEKLGEGGTMFGHSVYINGKRVNSGAGGSAEKINEYTMQEVMVNNLTEGNFTGDLNVKIVFSDPMINGKITKGRWVFEFKTNGDELAINTKEISLDNKFTLKNGQEIILEKYTSNNLGQKIYFISDAKGTEYDIILRGYDDIGNEITFYMSKTEDYTGVFKINNINENLNENAKTLYLTPYAVKFPEQNGRLSNDFKQVGEEFSIDLQY